MDEPNFAQKGGMSLGYHTEEERRTRRPVQKID